MYTLRGYETDTPQGDKGQTGLHFSVPLAQLWSTGYGSVTEYVIELFTDPCFLLFCFDVSFQF